MKKEQVTTYPNKDTKIKNTGNGSNRPSPKGTQKAIEQLRENTSGHNQNIHGSYTIISGRDAQISRENFFDVLERISRQVTKSDLPK